MKTNYQSSSLTVIIKYLIAPLVTILFLYELFMVGRGGDLGDFSLAELPVMAWAVVMVIFSAVYLKELKVTTQNIIIGRGKKEQILDYQNIDWIVQTYIGRPAIYLKYRHPENKRAAIIGFIPQIYTSEQFPKVLRHPYRELEVVDFIRTRVRITKGGYDASAEPSQWNFLWLILLSLLPFILISIWLMK